MHVKTLILNWLFVLTLTVGQSVAVEIQACNMHEQQTEQSMVMDDHAHHAAMAAESATSDNDSCCDDCACALSSCQSHHQLFTATDMTWHHVNPTNSFYHPSLQFNRSVEWPLRPPIS